MVKKIGKITISKLASLGKIDGVYSHAVDFWGHNEGSGYPCNENEIEKIKQDLINQHKKRYKIVVVDERIQQEKLW